MTVQVDWTTLDQPLAHLGIDFDYPGAPLPWRIIDRNTDRLHTRAATLDHAIAFIRAAVRHGDATGDDESIEFFRAMRVFDEFPSSGEGPGRRRRGRIAADPKAERASSAPVSLAAPQSELAPSPETFSVAVMADVIPIRKDVA